LASAEAQYYEGVHFEGGNFVIFPFLMVSMIRRITAEFGSGGFFKVGSRGFFMGTSLTALNAV
jgi:hypothetical protein